jgi:small-conductance mechanosensitive channel
MKNMDNRWEQLIFALIVLTIAFVVTRIVRYILGRFFKKAAEKLKVDPTHYNFFKNAVDFLIFLLAVIIIFRSIPAFREFGTTLLTGAGILAAIVGFASQQAFSNIVSGIFLVIFKPIRVGDRVKVGSSHSGDVEDITLRHTIIKDFENRRIVIPNSVISNETIINSTLHDEKVCVFLEFNISFDSDIDKALQLMQQEASQHPLCIDNRTEEEKKKGIPKVVTLVLDITEFAVRIRGYVWANNPSEGFDMKCDLLKLVKQKFDKESIEIPYPHRSLIYKNEPAS